MADWQTVFIILGAFLGVELLGGAVSVVTGGTVDIHNIAYDCSPERLVCPNTGYVNATRVQCGLLGCYEEQLGEEFTGYFSYEYAQRWDSDYGATYIPVLAEASGYEGTKHECILNLNFESESGETAQIEGVVKVNVTVGNLTHEYVFDTIEPFIDPIYGTRTTSGFFRTGCYESTQVIGTNAKMYLGIIEDREECAAIGEKKFLHALVADAWFPEGRYDCKKLNFWFIPMLLTFLIAIPLILSYYSATGVVSTIGINLGKR
jgi:hypothetical protein